MRTRLLICLAMVGIFSLLEPSAWGASNGKGSIEPTSLRTESDAEPLGVEVAQPLFTWLLLPRDPSSRGLRQSAYQIQVASSRSELLKSRADIWDSGKTSSEDTAHVPYGGPPPQSKKDYWWRVRVWDANGEASRWSAPAHWAMGLLHPADWSAKWIESPSKINMDHNGYRSELAANPDTPKWVMIDLACRPEINKVVLYPANPFESATPAPGYLFPKRFRIDVSDSFDFAEFRTVVDRTSEDVPNPGEKPLEYSFPTTQARYVRLFVTGHAMDSSGWYGFALAEMSVRDQMLPLSLAAARPHASDSFENGAWALHNLNDADTTSHRGRSSTAYPATMFRKEFVLPAKVKLARIYATALGAYELQVNGRRVGDRMLAPESTDYSKRVQYQVYDLTDLLRAGGNAIGAILGDGWYAGRPTYQPGRRIYGSKPRLLVQLEVELADGTRKQLVSDESWRSTDEGPIRSADNFDGEVYDQRREKPGWNLAGYNDSGWANAVAVQVLQTAIVSQSSEPIRVTESVRPVAITETVPGVYVVDMGQNIVGWVRARLQGKAGSVIKLRHAEMLKPDGKPYFENVWHSILGAEATDTYILAGNGSAATFEPHFTHHGFRYVEVSGLDYKPSLDDFVGRVVHSSAPTTGKFASSDITLNSIAEMALWTQRGNMVGIPTDCPQRSERLGWTGDGHIFSQAAMFNMDMSRFYEKWLRDMRDVQTSDGAYSSVAPSPVPGFPLWPNAPGWSDAGVIVPWNLYVSYGNRRMLTEHYDSAKRFVESVRTKNPDLIWRSRTFGDWLNGDTVKIGPHWPSSGAATPRDLFSTAYFARSTELLARMARILGRDKDAVEYQSLATKIHKAFQDKFVAEDGKMIGGPDEPDKEFMDRQGVAVSGDTQTAYGLALQFDLIPKDLRNAAATRLVQRIQDYDWHLSTGIQGTNPVMLSLADHGRADIAYRLLHNRTAPSWGYMIDQGATTIWERWDGYVAGRGFDRSGMNSFNHYALGAVSEWLYRNVLGINPDPDQPGYRSFVIRPRPGGGLTWASGEYRSIRGLIKSAWTLRDGAFELRVTVPVNTTAEIHIPSRQGQSITEQGRDAKKSTGVRAVRAEDRATVFEVQSGEYVFRSSLPPDKSE